MPRLIVLVLVVFVVFWLLRFIFEPPHGTANRRPPGAPPAGAGSGPAAGRPVERLVEDPVCGVRIPESRAIRDGDEFFCSEECRAKRRS